MTAFAQSCKDLEYFRNYAGSGRSYDQVWQQYTYVPELIRLLRSKRSPLASVKKILLLGAATGKVIPKFESGLRAHCWGCEINRWAYLQIPATARRRIRNEDMRDYVRAAKKEGRVFDLAFSNSLIYLPKKSVPGFLKNLAKTARALHFNSSFKGHACPDPARQTLESYDWWVAQFRAAGFEEVKIAGKRRSYLFRSTQIS